jgi:hypothetical protein
MSLLTIEKFVKFFAQHFEPGTVMRDRSAVTGIGGKPHLDSLDFLPQLVDLAISRGEQRH